MELVLTFSELQKMASGLYKHATEQEKRKIFQKVFSELFIKDNEIIRVVAKPAFQLFLERFDKLEKHDKLCKNKSIVHLGTPIDLFSELQQWHIFLEEYVRDFGFIIGNVAKKTSNLVIESDALHYKTDLYTN